MEIGICQLKRKSDHHSSRLSGQHVQIHGLDGRALEDATCSVWLRFVCCPMQNQTIGLHKDTPAWNLKRTTLGMIVQSHGSPNKRKHVPHPRTMRCHPLRPWRPSCRNCAENLEDGGVRRLGTTESGCAMLDLRLDGGRRGRERFDQPKAVRDVWVAFFEFTVMASSYASPCAFLVCSLRRQFANVIMAFLHRSSPTCPVVHKRTSHKNVTNLVGIQCPTETQSPSTRKFADMVPHFAPGASVL